MTKSFYSLLPEFDLALREEVALDRRKIAAERLLRMYDNAQERLELRMDAAVKASLKDAPHESIGAVLHEITELMKRRKTAFRTWAGIANEYWDANARRMDLEAAIMDDNTIC